VRARNGARYRIYRDASWSKAYPWRFESLPPMEGDGGSCESWADAMECVVGEHSLSADELTDYMSNKEIG
jgi:hypothetical protein